MFSFFQPGYGFQQQLVPGMRPGGPHMPNYFVPVVQQGQQGPRPGIRRGAGAQGQQPVQSFQQQVFFHQISHCNADFGWLGRYFVSGKMVNWVENMISLRLSAISPSWFSPLFCSFPPCFFSQFLYLYLLMFGLVCGTILALFYGGLVKVNVK